MCGHGRGERGGVILDTITKVRFGYVHIQLKESRETWNLRSDGAPVRHGGQGG